jgi:hypothetical protein
LDANVRISTDYNLRHINQQLNISPEIFATIAADAVEMTAAPNAASAQPAMEEATAAESAGLAAASATAAAAESAAAEQSAAAEVTAAAAA